MKDTDKVCQGDSSDEGGKGIYRNSNLNQIGEWFLLGREGETGLNQDLCKNINKRAEDRA